MRKRAHARTQLQHAQQQHGRAHTGQRERGNKFRAGAPTTHAVPPTPPAAFCQRSRTVQSKQSRAFDTPAPKVLCCDDEGPSVLVLEPVAEDLLGLPAGVDVCCVDEVAARRHERVEHFVRRPLVRRVAERHGPEAQFTNLIVCQKRISTRGQMPVRRRSWPVVP